MGKFCQVIRSRRILPIVIRDAEKITEETPKELDGITQFPEAVFNMELRIALYELSYICMFVSNGPAEIGFYNKNISYLYFVTGNWLTERPTRLKAKVSLLGIHHPSQQLTKNGSGRLLMRQICKANLTD